MFSQTLIDAIVAAAGKEGLEPAAALALVEVETAGATFEQDGRTPQFLYERHIAWRQARKVSAKLCSAFASAGLAIPQWSKSTQYKDEGSSSSRLALIGRARAINEEVANQSASWGVGQTMGFLYSELGFESANAMVDHMTGSLAGQIDCMFRELKHQKLIEPLNKHEWVTVARIYNGAGYAANRYDARLADAWKRWARKFAAGGKITHPAPSLSHDELRDVQSKLRALGYASVGKPDGFPGRKTVGALSEFQAHEGLPVSGVYDDATRNALQTAEPVEQTRERKTATADDLAAAGSKTIKTAKAGGLFASAKAAIGSLFVGGGVVEKLGLLDTAQAGIDKANQVKGIWSSLCDLAHPLFAGPTPIAIGAVLIGSGFGTYLLFRRIKAHRVEDHISGVHAGPEGE